MKVILNVSTRKNKKYMVTLEDGKVIHFGQRGYADFTQHHDIKRQEQYLRRHKKNEDWEKTGIETPGFWARWICWSQPFIDEAIRNTEDKFDLEIESNI